MPPHHESDVNIFFSCASNKLHCVGKRLKFVCISFHGTRCKMHWAAVEVNIPRKIETAIADNRHLVVNWRYTFVCTNAATESQQQQQQQHRVRDLSFRWISTDQRVLVSQFHYAQHTHTRADSGHAYMWEYSLFAAGALRHRYSYVCALVWASECYYYLIRFGSLSSSVLTGTHRVSFVQTTHEWALYSWLFERIHSSIPSFTIKLT